MIIAILWSSSKFHINGKNTSDIVYCQLPFLDPRLRNIFRFCVFYPERIWWKRVTERVKCLLCLAFERRGEGRASLGQITSTSLFAPASAPGELEMHRRSQKTWVESWLCHLLPMWLWVSYLMSLGLSFSTGLLWGLSNMIKGNVLCKLPRSIEI